MLDGSKSGQFNPFEDWNKMFQSLMGSAAVPQNSIKPWQAIGNSTDVWSVMLQEMWQSNNYKKMLSMQPQDIAESYQQFWTDSLHNTMTTVNNYTLFMEQYMELLTGESQKVLGEKENVAAVAKPQKDDKRFSAPEWNNNVVFDSIKQYYLLAATTVLKNTSEMRGLDDKQQQKLMFYLHFFLDAISPSNFGFTNPEVIKETINSNGQNLVAGMQHLLRDIKDGRIKMTDTEAFAAGRNLAITPGQVIYRNRLIELIQYTPTTEKVQEIPILFVPHWINRYYILDLQPHNSLIKELVSQGFTVFVISWKNPDASMEDITFEDYLTLGPLTALEIAKEVSGSKKVNMAGYCIGGTLLSMTLPYLKAIGDDSVNSATFFVALQDFTEVGDTSVFIDEPQVALLEGQMREMGYLDSRQMASMFNMLRDNDLIWSNMVNNYLLGKEPPAFDLLYWNADGTRMTPQGHSFYLHNTYLENNLIKPGKIVLKGVPIDLRNITQDIYAVGAAQDHIVPWKSAWRITQLANANVRFVLGGSGHIAGVINPPAKGRGYWINEKPVATAEEWFTSAKSYKGSWWLDWVEWLRTRSGELVNPPPTGNNKYQPLVPAPGTYVLEK